MLVMSVIYFECSRAFASANRRRIARHATVDYRGVSLVDPLRQNVPPRPALASDIPVQQGPLLAKQVASPRKSNDYESPR